MESYTFGESMSGGQSSRRMSVRKIFKFGIVALSFVALPGMASAATMAFGTFSFGPSLGTEFTFTNTPAGNSLGSQTTQIVLPAQFVASIPATYLFNPNSFSAAGPDPSGILASGQSLSFLAGTDTINISGGLASALDFVFSSGTTPVNRYEFISTGQGVVLASPGFVNITYDGQFTDAAGFFNTQTARVTITFTQAGPGGATFEGGSFSTPAVPEPASMALIGGGLVAIGLVARQKKKKKA